MNLNVTWSRRWRQRDAASSRRRRRGCQRVCASRERAMVVSRRRRSAQALREARPAHALRLCHVEPRRPRGGDERDGVRVSHEKARPGRFCRGRTAADGAGEFSDQLAAITTKEEESGARYNGIAAALLRSSLFTGRDGIPTPSVEEAPGQDRCRCLIVMEWV